jgi:ferritin
MQTLDAKLAEALQVQHTLERHNQAAYIGLGSGFTALGLSGLARWARHQAEDEAGHAASFADYLTDKRNVLAEVRPLEGADFAFTEVVAAFTEGARLEAQTTEAIHTLYSLAEDVEDYDALEFLHWFIAEQRNSEANFKNWLARLRLIVGDGAGILAFDRELGGME